MYRPNAGGEAFGLSYELVMGPHEYYTYTTSGERRHRPELELIPPLEWGGLDLSVAFHSVACASAQVWLRYRDRRHFYKMFNVKVLTFGLLVFS